MARLKEQTTFQPLENNAFKLGQSLMQFRRRRKPQVNINQYTNLRNVINNALPNTSSYNNTPAYNKIRELGQITTPYGGNTNYESFHPGIDIAAPKGTPIKSFTGGKVTNIRTGQGWTPNKPSFGNYIIITTPTGEKLRYSHLYQNFVKLGDQIQPGQEIGSIGGTGSTYSQWRPGPGYHLDLRIKDAYNRYVNPISYLNKIYARRNNKK